MSTGNKRRYYDHLGRPAWPLLKDDDDHWFSKWQNDNEGNINKTNVHIFKQK